MLRGPFEDGVALLKEFGKPSGALLFILSTGDDMHNRQLLDGELAHIQEAAKKRVEERRPVIQVSVSAVGRAQDLAEAKSLESTFEEDPRPLPPELLALRQDLKTKHKLMMHLKGAKSKVPNGMDLRHIALQIVDLYDEMRAGWLVIETWRSTGQVLKLGPEAGPVDVAALIKRRNSLRAQLSKAKKGTRTVTEDQKAIWESERDALTIQIDGADPA